MRLVFRLPIWFYRLGLGGLLGHRFLLLTHTGRKTGTVRQTVLEVVRYDKGKHSFIVAAGFGSKSDWYRNIQVNPSVSVQSGTQRWDMTAGLLPPGIAGEVLLDYAGRHPAALRKLAQIMGYQIDGTPESIRELGEKLPMVVFRPIEA